MNLPLPDPGARLPGQASVGMSRRHCLAALGGLALSAGPAAHAAHGDLGPVEPRRLPPDLELTLHDGGLTRLSRLLQGQVTALQLMFTACSGTCPIQGAIFSALQQAVAGRVRSARLLSISLDPLNDDPARLSGWLRSHGASAAWRAAAPPARHADVLLDFVQGRPKNGAVGDRHSAQVYLFDIQGRLAYRCAEFAAPGDIARLMLQLASLPS
jgi:protein SCO1/2